MHATVINTTECYTKKVLVKGVALTYIYTHIYNGMPRGLLEGVAPDRNASGREVQLRDACSAPCAVCSTIGPHTHSVRTSWRVLLFQRSWVPKKKD